MPQKYDKLRPSAYNNFDAAFVDPADLENTNGYLDDLDEETYDSRNADIGGFSLNDQYKDEDPKRQLFNVENYQYSDGDRDMDMTVPSSRYPSPPFDRDGANHENVETAFTSLQDLSSLQNNTYMDMYEPTMRQQLIQNGDNMHQGHNHHPHIDIPSDVFNVTLAEMFAVATAFIPLLTSPTLLFNTVIKPLFKRDKWPIWCMIASSAVTGVAFLLWRKECITFIENVVEWCKTNKFSGAAALIGALMVSCIPPVFGYSTILYLCGFVYGFPYGFIPGFIGAFLGSMFTFVLFKLKFLGRLLNFESLIPRWNAIAYIARGSSLKLIVLIRLAPYPFNVMNVLFSQSGIPFKRYALATGISLIKTLIHIQIGATVGVIANLAGGHSSKGKPKNKTTEIVKLAVLVSGILLGVFLALYLSIVVNRIVSFMEKQQQQQANQQHLGVEGYSDISEEDEPEISLHINPHILPNSTPDVDIDSAVRNSERHMDETEQGPSSPLLPEISSYNRRKSSKNLGLANINTSVGSGKGARDADEEDGLYDEEVKSIISPVERFISTHDQEFGNVELLAKKKVLTKKKSPKKSPKKSQGDSKHSRTKSLPSMNDEVVHDGANASSRSRKFSQPVNKHLPNKRNSNGVIYDMPSSPVVVSATDPTTHTPKHGISSGASRLVHRRTSSNVTSHEDDGVSEIDFTKTSAYTNKIDGAEEKAYELELKEERERQIESQTAIQDSNSSSIQPIQRRRMKVLQSKLAQSHGIDSSSPSIEDLNTTNLPSSLSPATLSSVDGSVGGGGTRLSVLFEDPDKAGPHRFSSFFEEEQ